VKCVSEKARFIDPRWFQEISRAAVVLARAPGTDSRVNAVISVNVQSGRCSAQSGINLPLGDPLCCCMRPGARPSRGQVLYIEWYACCYERPKVMVQRRHYSFQYDGAEASEPKNMRAVCARHLAPSASIRHMQSWCRSKVRLPRLRPLSSSQRSHPPRWTQTGR